MRNRWPILALLCVLASLLVPGIASANSAAGAEDRVWAFDLAEPVLVGGERSLALEPRQGYELVDYDCASGSLLAARGAVNVTSGARTVDEALTTGQRFVGEGATELIDENHWRTIRLSMDDGSVNAVLLRPLPCLQHVGATVGQAIALELAGPNIIGRARVLEIGPCPPLGEQGPGRRVVTGTFVRPDAEVLEVWLDESSGPIGTTEEHPFWSVRANGWTRAGDLTAGDEVRCLNGVARVSRVIRTGTSDSVYNLEVHRDHTFGVGDLAVWVHNDCAMNPGKGPDAPTGGGGGGGGEFSRGGPPREPGTGNFLPDPDATGPHTTLGPRTGGDGKPYTQGATFDGEGNFLGRTDATNHGRADHPDPHFHPATGPNSANSPAQPIPTPGGP